MDEVEVERHEVQDTNLEQTFILEEKNQNLAFSTLKLEFPKASDLFGRVILYKLDLLK